jgi:hypothetical protein
MQADKSSTAPVFGVEPDLGAQAARKSLRNLLRVSARGLKRPSAFAAESVGLVITLKISNLFKRPSVAPQG